MQYEDFKKYNEVDLPFYLDKSWKEERVKVINETPLTEKDRKEKLANLEEEYKVENRKVIEAYRNSVDLLHKQFEQDMYKEFDLNRFNEKTVKMLNDMAWEAGHASGYYNVYMAYIDLVDLLETTLES